MKKMFKRLVLLSVVASSALFANPQICDDSKINQVFSKPLNAGAEIVKKEESQSLQGFCEVYLKFNGNVDLLFLNGEKNIFIGGGQLISYNETSNEYTSITKLKVDELSKEVLGKKLSDKKELDKFYQTAFVEYSKDSKKPFVNKKYEILIFSSKVCPHCNELDKDLSIAFEKENIKLYKFYIPINQDDFINLKTNIYKDEEKLKNAIGLHNTIGGGVPTVIVRDAKTKEFVDFIQALKGENLEKLKNYIKEPKK